jgi:hypothetical protein
VVKLLIGLAQNAARALHVAPEELNATVADVNGEPAVLFWVRDQLDTVLVCAAVEDRVGAIRAIRNPDKLAYIQRQLRNDI